jgi:phospholipase/carboxylesterase
MNRIQQRLDVELDMPTLAPASGRSRHDPFQRPTDVGHCIFTPKHYEPNYAYPLVVWLHGPGDDERQVTRVMPHVSDRNYVAVGPRATDAAVPPAVGYAWTQHPDAIEEAERRVTAAIAAARHWLNIAPDRIFLAGFAEGGTMAYRIALARPHSFAGVLSFGGPFPAGLRPLAEYRAARRTKIFLTTGRQAEHYCERDVCRDLRLFHAAGMSVCLRLYPCGDDLTTAMLADMDRWIMEQVAPRPAQQDQGSQRSRRQ